MDSTLAVFITLLGNNGIIMEDYQIKQFELYYSELIVWNEKMNLTGITEREQVFIKHFYDSLSLSFFVPITQGMSIADIGSGAGFPSIPIKIAFPHIKVTIIDSLNKRIQFLNHLVSKLGLHDVDCIHSRAEDAARILKLRDQFDLVTARAVARLNVLNELSLPFVRPGGYFVAMKGSEPSDEITEAAFSARELKATLHEVKSLELPIEQSKRHLVIYKKLQETPLKYPRRAGIPSNEPL